MSIHQDNLNTLAVFAEVAERYCTFIDSLKTSRPPGLYAALEKLLVEIHTAILPVEKDLAEELPPKEQRQFDGLAMTHDEWCDLAKVIGKATRKESDELVAWHKGLRGEDNSADDFHVTRASMLWDDLADIYRDLDHGRRLWSLKDSAAQAAWEWRYGYEIHWGEHLFRAMTSVHEIRYQMFVE